MPAKFTIKPYVEDGIYHLLNRGVNKSKIFLDDHDHKTFLFYIKRLLTPIDLFSDEVRPRYKTDLHDKINLLAFCLMPNHFHLLIQQTKKDSITIFMRSLLNAYVKYFNEKHNRQGSLFQGKLKGILVDNDEYLLYLTKYIHRNPLSFWRKSLIKFPFSSYPYYLGNYSTYWIKPQSILEYFNSDNTLTNFHHNNSFQNFTEQDDSSNYLEDLTLESDD